MRPGNGAEGPVVGSGTDLTTSDASADKSDATSLFGEPVSQRFVAASGSELFGIKHSGVPTKNADCPTSAPFFRRRHCTRKMIRQLTPTLLGIQCARRNVTRR